MEKTIEINCDPFSSKPDTYIRSVIDGTGLLEKKPMSKLFGNWKWDYSDVSDKFWKKIQPILASRIKALYRAGQIKYGSW